MKAADLTAWINANWNEMVTVAEWWEVLAAAGLCAAHDGEVEYVFADLGVLGPPAGVGLSLVAPTLSTMGTEQQITRFVPRIRDGTEAWCQLFSEPNAGSDLASPQTRATRTRGGWIVSGDKTWSSAAQFADFGFLLARTGEGARHKGISAFVLDMSPPTVVATPLADMAGGTEFATVAIKDAFIPHDHLIGVLDVGWSVAVRALAIERGYYRKGSARVARVLPGRAAGNLDRHAADAARTATATISTLALDDVFRLHERCHDARASGRQTLARLHATLNVAEMVGTSNVAKLLYSGSFRVLRDVAAEILGPRLMLDTSEREIEQWLQRAVQFSPAPSIYGGSDEIQRNIIGERVLGLPREPGGEET